MSDINGIDFQVSTSFTPEQANRILGWLAEATRGPTVSSFLTPLKGKTFYITALTGDGFEGAYNGLKHLATEQFYSVGLDGVAYVGVEQAAPFLSQVENIEVTFGLAKTGSDDQDTRAAPFFSTPDGKAQFDPARALFHELAHAVTTPDRLLESNFGGDDTAYAGVEALAVAAEDLIYTTDHGGAQRVGHVAVLGDPTTQSFDPKAAFYGLSNIKYDNIALPDGTTAGVFKGSVFDGGEIQKAYGSAKDTLNFVTITGLKASIVGDGTELSDTFTYAMTSILASPDQVQMKLARAHDALADLSNGLNDASVQAAVGMDPAIEALSGIALTSMDAVIGNSNERFTDGGRVNYVGPVDASGNSRLGFTAARAGILIGSSGDFDSDLTADPSNRLASATDNLTAFATGTSVLIAGEGSSSSPNHNELRGGNGSDVFVGGSGSDEIFADKGADVVVQSIGADVVYGNGKTVFAVDRLAVNPVIDTRSFANGLLNVVDSYDSTSKTTLDDVHIFVGNQCLTKFIGSSSSKDLFIAGSGGGDFTLTAGDVAVGSLTASDGNIYRVSSGAIGNISIVGFGAKDKLYIDGTLFTGTDETFMLLPHSGEVGVDGVGISATSSWSVGAPDPQPVGSSYGFVSGRYADVTYTPDSAGSTNGTLRIAESTYTDNGTPIPLLGFLGPTSADTRTDLRLHIFGSSTSLPGIDFNYHYGEGLQGRSGSLIPFPQGANDPLSFDSGGNPSVGSLLAAIESQPAHTPPDVILDGSTNIVSGTGDSDSFVIGAHPGYVVIGSFDPSSPRHDYLDFSSSQLSSFQRVLALTSQQGSDLVIAIDANDSVTLSGIALADFTDQDIKLAGTSKSTGLVVDAGSNVNGGFTELTSGTDESAVRTAQGTIQFDDFGAGHAHAAIVSSVAASGFVDSLPDRAALLNLLDLTVTDEPVGSTPGDLKWLFSTANRTFDYLTEGQSVTLTYQVMLSDQDGDVVTEPVVITITGANHAPVIASDAKVTAFITEQGAPASSLVSDAASGVIRFTDVEVGDIHSAAVASVGADGVVAGLPDAATMLAWLSTSGLVEQSGSTAGSVAWNFAAPDSAFSYLGAGQTATLTYALQIADGQGGIATQNVVVTVTGAPAGTPSNEQVSGSFTGSIAELASTTGSATNDTASGTIEFTDPDFGDTHSTSITGVTATGVTSGLPANATLLGWLADGALTEQSGTAAGSLPWTFAASDSAFDYLGAGQVATLTYAVQIADSKGSVANQNITITVTGTNDAPTIAAGTVSSAAITGLGMGAGSSQSDTAFGVIQFTDPDVDDTHSASVASVSANGIVAGLPDAATMLAWLSMSGLTEQSGSTAGSAAWNFAAPDSAFSYLGAGQTATLTYALQIADGQGGVATQNVVVTITGGPATPVTLNGLITLGANAGTEVINPAGGENADTIAFDATVDEADVTLQANGDDLVVTDQKAGFALTVKNNFWSYYGRHAHVGTVSFADGTSWSVGNGASTTFTYDGSAGGLTLTGSGYGNNNVFLAGTGDTLSGTNSDTYKVAASAGAETINPAGGENADTIAFDATVNEADVTLQANGDDLIVTDQKAGISLTVKNNFWSYYGRHAHVSTISFADGTSVSVGNGASTTFTYDGSAGGQALTGSGYGNTNFLVGGNGDTLNGVNSDTYKFSSSAGIETINPAGSENADTIAFDTSVSEADLTLQVAGNDLIVADQKAGISLTVKNDFWEYYGRHSYVSAITFADGTSWSLANDAPAAFTYDGSAGNQTLTGSSWRDSSSNFVGGNGDTLTGGTADTYRFGASAGTETINPASGENADTIAFDATVNEADVTLETVGNDLVISDQKAGISLTVKNNFWSYYGRHTHVSTINFADNTSWSLGNGSNLTFSYDGSAGNQAVTGSGYGANVIVGGSGDTLNGVKTDLYKFGASAGTEIINPASSENADTIQFDASIAEADVTLQAVGNDLVVTDQKAGISLTVKNDLWEYYGRHSYVSAISFADGTNWSLANNAPITFTYDGSAGNQALAGSGWRDSTSDFLGGNGDTLTGGTADTYRFGSSAGTETINPANGENADTITFDAPIAEADVTLQANGNDLIVIDEKAGILLTVKNNFWSYYGRHAHVNTISFADGTSWSVGNGASTTFTYYGSAGGQALTGSGYGDTNVFLGGTGDTLTGVNSDVYKFGASAGTETINSSYKENADTIAFDATVNEADVTLQAVGNDLIVTDQKAGISLTAKNNFWSSYGRHAYVNTISFADGTSWSVGIGASTTFTYDGTAGNQTLQGTQYGNTNVFLGGTGDTMNGSNNDIYKFGANAGTETIHPSGNENADTIAFDATISEADVTLQAVGNDLIVTDQKAGVSIAATSNFWSYYGRHAHVATISFADGTSWSIGNGASTTFTYDGTAGGQTLIGSGYGDTNVFLGGNGDTMTGANSDIYKFGSSAGTETINPASGENADTIQFDATVNASDVTLRANGNDLIVLDQKNGVAVTVAGDLWDYYGQHTHVNTINFADGTVWDLKGWRPGALIEASDSTMPLVGTSGADTFAFDQPFSSTEVDGFTTDGVNHDMLQIGRNVFQDWAHLLGTTQQVGNDLSIKIDDTTTIMLTNVALSSFRQSNVCFA